MDAMQNDSANAGVAVDENEQADAVGAEAAAGDETAAAPRDASSGDETASADAASVDTGSGDAASAEPAPGVSAAEAAEVAEMPQPRAADAEASSGKGKKRKAAPKSKAAAATKSLVVFRDGKVHYADESVVVLDLDEAAHPDTDVHDVVDKLSELRDAVESPGRTEAVTLVAELIQTKAFA